MNFSDHRPVTLTWAHRAPAAASASPEDHPPVASPVGWRFQGTITEARKEQVVLKLEADPRLASVHSVLQAEGATAAYRLLHAIVRDAWSAVGITVCQDNGMRLFSSQPHTVPVDGWYDEEVATAMRVWRRLRRRRRNHPELREDCQRARRAYEKLRTTKMRRWEQRWERFWVDVARCNHTTVWRVIRAMSGRKNLDCQCSEPAQHITKTLERSSRMIILTMPARQRLLNGCRTS